MSKARNLISVFLFVVATISSSSALAQAYAGRYAMDTGAGNAVLEFESEDAGQYSGTLSNAGFTVGMRGAVVDGVLQGGVDDGSDTVVFVAEIQNEVLTLTLLEIDAAGEPNPESAQVLVFQAADQDAQAPAADVNFGEVIINGLSLTDDQRSQFAGEYGIAPLPGNYWYDPRSGLYGVSGYQAFGFMLPGHEFGTPDRNASQGDTGVLVNGRELPLSEWLIWSYMLGAPIQIGSYWLDEQANAGYEGVALPIVNLYVAAQQNAYQGQGGSGENFWSSRFSAGNYDSGNTRGYVSVPGHGPVGYGF